MSLRRNFLNWGIFLICLGAVPLAVQLGALDAHLTVDLLRLWPLILIGIGLGMLLRLTPYAALGGIGVAAIAGLLVGTALSGGIASGGAFACSGNQAGGPSIVRSGTIAGPIQVNAELTCADVDITRAAGSDWFAEAVAGGGAPTIESSGSSLTLRSQEGFGPLSGDRETWRIRLPSEAEMGGDWTFNAAQADVDLGDGPVGGLSVTYNAVDGVLDLSGTSGNPSLSATLNATSLDLIAPSVSMNASLTLNAASLDVCTPVGSALRINYSNTLGSNNFAAAGLIENADTWQSPDYATAQTQLDLDVDANVSSININPAGGCQ